MSEFRRRTLAGLVWSLIAQVGRQSLVLGIDIVLSRFFLGPADYGLFMMMAVVANYAQIFTDMGFSAALVQRKEISEDHLSSVFWLNFGVGVLMTVVFAAVSPLMAVFYDEPRLGPLAVWVSLAFVIGSLKIVQSVQFTRALDFRTIAKIEALSVGISGIVTILLAWRGFGPMALVANFLMIAGLNTLLHWAYSPWRPKLRFDRSTVRELTGFSANFMGTQSLNYWARNLDNLLIGRYVGGHALGAYAKAYSLMLFPINNISRVVQKVMFPAASSIQDDPARVKRLYLRLTGVVSLMSFPMMAGLYATVEPAVLTLYGERWIDMAPILRVLAFAGAMQSITTLNGILFLSQGRADLQFRLGLLLKLNFFVAFVVGLKWGVMGVTWGFTIASLFNSWPNMYFSSRLVGLGYVENLAHMAGTFLCSVAMAAAVIGLDVAVANGWAPPVRLAFLAGSGVAIYVALLAIFRVEAFRDLLEIARERSRRGRRRGAAS